MSGISKIKLFRRTRQTDEGPKIGMPTDVRRVYHVTKNAQGIIEGFPQPWIRDLDSQVTKQEQEQNPDAAAQAVLYYNYLIARKNDQPYKQLVTEEAAAQESNEIINILHPEEKKTPNAVKPTENNCEISEISKGLEEAKVHEGAASPILRTKTYAKDATKKTDAEVWAELQKNCKSR